MRKQQVLSESDVVEDGYSGVMLHETTVTPSRTYHHQRQQLCPISITAFRYGVLREMYTVVVKTCHFISDYSSRVSW